MIGTLSIRRFKSIRDLSIPCRKVNLFLGAPDTGKTNILDALQILSLLGWGLPIGPWLRLGQTLGFDQLFYGQFFDKPFEISFDQSCLTAKIGGQDRRLTVELTPPHTTAEISIGGAWHVPDLHWIRFYSYHSSEAWQYTTGHQFSDTIITPPHGGNLMYIARHNAKVNDFLKETVSALNWKLRFDPNQKRFMFCEDRGDEFQDYNIELVSDSVKRLFFYGAILLTSQKATIVLDEPDVYAFPPYPKTLAEMIAADESNQFFLTTHNPYFLSGLVEKTPADRLAVFVCHRDPKGGTTAKLLAQPQVEQVIEQGASVFFNLDDFLKA